MLSKEFSGGSFGRTAALSAAATFSYFDGKLRFSGLRRGPRKARFTCFRGRSLLDSASETVRTLIANTLSQLCRIMLDVWRKLGCPCRIAPL
jgi:hypothetical protein